MCNLKRFASNVSHMRWGHGQKYLQKNAIIYWKLTYPVLGTPTWFKSGVFSVGGRSYENIYGYENY